MGKVYVFLADDCEETEAIAPMDVLFRAGVDVVGVSIMGRLEIAGAHGFKLSANQLIEDTDFTQADMLVLPGGAGYVKLQQCSTLTDQLAAFAGDGKKVAAICASPTILAGLGLLKGKKATVFTGMEAALTENGATYQNAAVVCEGNIITAKGPGSALQFGIALVAAIKGDDAAKAVQEEMCIE